MHRCVSCLLKDHKMEIKYMRELVKIYYAITNKPGYSNNVGTFNTNMKSEK